MKRSKVDESLYKTYSKRLNILQSDIAKAIVDEDLAKAYRLIEKFAEFNKGVVGVIDTMPSA